MRIVLGTLIFIISNTLLYSQKEGYIWYFGYHCGFDFTQGSPIVLKDGKVKINGSSAVATNPKTGELLFYTDGRNFWNSNHELMQNKFTKTGDCWVQLTQPALIIPSTENSDLFDVFLIQPISEDTDTINCRYYPKLNSPYFESGLALYYYQVDMTLNNGLGNIVEERSQILVRQNVTEKLIAVPHSNGSDYWVIVHGWESNIFYAYQLAAAGIADTVTTEIGSVHSDNHNWVTYHHEETAGEMKASPNGKKIACAVSLSTRPFDLFDFDATTGSLSNYINLGNWDDQYGLSFSPDNSKLYFMSDSLQPIDSSDPSKRTTVGVMQFDLEAGSNEAIIASGRSILIGNPFTNIVGGNLIDGIGSPVYAKKGMSLAPDGRLYISTNASNEQPEMHTMVLIDNPNEKGFNCGINYKEFDFGMGSVGMGLPNSLQSYFNEIQPISYCQKSSLISIYPIPTQSSVKIEIVDGCQPWYSVRIFDILGQMVLESRNNLNDQVIELSDFPNSMYLFAFYSHDKLLFTKRVIKAP